MSPDKKGDDDLPKLTKAEQHLIDFPPNAGTWQCNRTHKLKSTDAAAPDAEYVCSSVQTKKHSNCVICQQPKSRKAIELRPKYLAACQKAGVEPKGNA